MLRSMKDLMGFTIGATDGGIGRVAAGYFDDATFTVRHLVVDTGGAGSLGAARSRRSLRAAHQWRVWSCPGEVPRQTALSPARPAVRRSEDGQEGWAGPGQDTLGG